MSQMPPVDLVWVLLQLQKYVVRSVSKSNTDYVLEDEKSLSF